MVLISSRNNLFYYSVTTSPSDSLQPTFIYLLTGYYVNEPITLPLFHYFFYTLSFHYSPVALRKQLHWTTKFTVNYLSPRLFITCSTSKSTCPQSPWCPRFLNIEIVASFIFLELVQWFIVWLILILLNQHPHNLNTILNPPITWGLLQILPSWVTFSS